MNIGCLNFGQIIMEYLCHRRAGNVGSLLRKPRICQISSGMFGICHVHVGNNIYNSPVCLFRQTFILTAITCFHVKNRDMKPLRPDYRQTAVRIAKNKHRIRLNLHHQLVGLRNNIPHCLPKIGTNRVQINLRLVQLQILKKYTIQIIIIILTGMCQNYIKICSALLNNSRQADNLRPRTNNNQKL